MMTLQMANMSSICVSALFGSVAELFLCLLIDVLLNQWWAAFFWDEGQLKRKIVFTGRIVNNACVLYLRIINP